MDDIFEGKSAVARHKLVFGSLKGIANINVNYEWRGREGRKEGRKEGRWGEGGREGGGVTIDKVWAVVAKCNVTDILNSGVHALSLTAITEKVPHSCEFMLCITG